MSTNSTGFITGFYFDYADVKISNYYSYNLNRSIETSKGQLICEDIYIDGNTLGENGIKIFEVERTHLSNITVFNQTWDGIQVEKGIKDDTYLENIYVKNADAGIRVMGTFETTITNVTVENAVWNVTAFDSNSVIIQDSPEVKLYASDSDFTCINTTNSTDTSLGGSSSLIRKWWVDVYVDDMVGPINSATVKIYDFSLSLETQATTGDDGFAYDVPVIDRIFKPAMESKNPHRTYAQGPGWFAQNNTPYQVVGNKWVNVTYAGNAPPSPPTYLQVESDENSDTVLTWTPSSSLDVAFYSIYIAETYGDLYSYLNSSIPNTTVFSNSFTHKGGSEDWGEFWYAVKANDSENESVGVVITSCGNWVINKTVPQYLNDQNITLKGSLYVYGNAEFNNSILNFSPKNPTNLVINNSGNFKCENVTIQAKSTEPYYFWIYPDAMVSINDSLIDRPGLNKYGFYFDEYYQGIYSLSRNLSITNSKILVEYYGLGIYHTTDFIGNLDNITFETVGFEKPPYLLKIYSSTGVKINNCDFGADPVRGIYAKYSDDIEITKSNIDLETNIDTYWGVHFSECTNSKIYDNPEIRGKPAVYIENSINVTVEKSVIKTPHEAFGIYAVSSLFTTILNCEFGQGEDRPHNSIYMTACQYSAIEDLNMVSQSHSIYMEYEEWSNIRNVTIDGGDTGISMLDSKNVNLFDTYITFLYNGMTLTGCRDITLFNVTINLTFYCLDIFSPGVIYLINCTIENGIGAEVTAEGYQGEPGVVHIINSTINPLSDNALYLNNSAVVLLLNTTVNKTKIAIQDSASRVEIFHYLSIQVYDIDNSIPAWANITIFNDKYFNVFSDQANNGRAEWIVIHQETIFIDNEYSDNPHIIYFDDGSHSGSYMTDINSTQQLNVYVSNILPWVSGVDIYGYFDMPAGGNIISYEPTTKFDINLTYLYQDQENDPEAGTTIHWYVNGVHNSTFDGMTVIDAQYTSKHQTWKVIVYPSDGYDNTYPTYPFESNVVYIGNTPPMVSNVTVSPSIPTGGDDLKVDYNFFDLDSDGLVSSKSTHKWEHYNETLGGWVYSNIDSTTLPNSYTKKSERWRCVVTPNDGDDDGLTVLSEEVVIGNTAPEVTDAEITPEVPKSNESFIVDYTYYDLDTDPETDSIIKWYKNDVEQTEFNGTSQIDPENTLKGDVWYYVVTPNDGVNFGAPVQSKSVTIDNTVPKIMNISIEPLNPTTADDLTVVYEFYDADSDEESHETIVEWLVWSGVEFTHTGLRVKTLSSSYTLKNEIWTCEITPHDNYEYGETVRATVTVTIDNSVPTVSDFYVNPSSPTTSDDLTANYKFADLDNELENGTEVQWYRNDMIVPELNNKVSVDKNYTQKGQTWYFRVRPRDGFEFGEEGQSETVMIQNGAPSAANLTITPRFPLGDDMLKASYLYADPDGDNESTPEIRWYRNGLLQGFYNDMVEVEATATEKGDLWYFTLRVFDGIDYSEEVDSHYIVVENSKPVLLSLSPDPGNLVINEVESKEFLVDAYDPDGDLLLFKWRLDKSTVSDSEYYLLETDYDSKGTYELNLTIQDIGKNSFTLSYIWQITVVNTNRIPTIEVQEPLVKNPRVKEDSTIKFEISVDEPDTDDDVDITWYLDDVVIPDEDSKTLNFRATHANIGKREIKAEVTDSYSTVEYSWNLTVEEQTEELGPLGLEWDVWGIMLEVIVLLVTGLLAFIGYRRLSKKKGALKVYMDEIEEISKLKDKDPEKYETRLNELEEKVNTEFRDGKMEDLHFLMLQELLATKRGEVRRATVSKKFRSLPKGIASNLEEMLKDDKISKDEYMSFVATMQKSKTLTPYEKKELSKMVSKWEVEDTGVSGDDALAQKIKTRDKVELAEWEDEEGEMDEE
jgi:hypothetical protein